MENNILKEFIMKKPCGGFGRWRPLLSCLYHLQRLTGKAKLLIKEKGILAGVRIASELFSNH